MGSAGNHNPIGMIVTLVRNDLCDPTIADFQVVHFNAIFDPAAPAQGGVQISRAQMKRIYMIAGRVVNRACHISGKQRFKTACFRTVKKFAIN